MSLQQPLRIVAVRLVESPVAAKIHAGGRRLVEFFARTGRKAEYRQNYDSHPAIL